MRKALGTLALAGTLLLVPVASASADTTSPAPMVTNAASNVDDNSDKTGLWGPLGLIGLAGLIRRTPDRSHDTTSTAVRDDVRR